MGAISKQALREIITVVRLRLSPEDRALRSQQIAARVVSLDAFARAETIALYSAMQAEVDEAEIAQAALAGGKRVAYPLVVPGQRALAFAICSPERLVPGVMGTREPPPGSPVVPPEEIDLALVPGVAFDVRCGRLGRGRGHYDATLARLRPSAARVGLAFEVQLVPSLPSEPHDESLDAVVTESRVLARRDSH